jgi:hypothetical protein
MEAISEDRLVHVYNLTSMSQTEPHVPVVQQLEALVESADVVKDVLPNQGRLRVWKESQRRQVKKHVAPTIRSRIAQPTLTLPVSVDDPTIPERRPGSPGPLSERSH